MKIFNGKKAAQKILRELSRQIKKKKIRPVLAAILVGEEESSKLYLKLKKEAGRKAGIEVRDFCFSGEVSQQELFNKIRELNENEEVSGIIIQLPLPAILNTDRVIEAIEPAKDVDGFHPENRRLLEKGREPNFMPVLPTAILWTISEAAGNNLQNFKNKNILALVNSETFGQTLKLILQKEGLSLRYQARNTCLVLGLEKEIRQADVLISVCGCPNLIKGEMIKSGAILIDSGITRYYDGKVAGDVNRESVKDNAAFLTPVPGGIGPLTVALLLRNVYLAASK